MPVPVLLGTSVKLRPPIEDDVDHRLALGQPAEVMLMFGAEPSDVPPISRLGAEAFFARLATHSHAWVIEHQGQFVGEIRLDDLDLHDKRARLAVGIYDATKLGQGIGREAIRLVLDHAFYVLQLHRVGLRVIGYNDRAIRCYRACGFVEEGREREAAYVSGRWHDDILMGILAKEYRRA